MKTSARLFEPMAMLVLMLVGCDAGKTSDAAGGTGGTITTTDGTGSAVGAAVVVSAASPVPVAPTFFGQNYWSWVPEWGDPVAGIAAPTTELRLGMLRAGGANNDRQEPVAFSLSEVDDFVSFARQVGAEPLLQVPLIKTIDGAVPSAEDAASLVTYVNVTKAYGIKYFSIGNEPDLYEEQKLTSSGYGPKQFCASFREMAAAMRAVDDTIQLVGPDLSWKYVSGANDWLTPFLRDCGDVTDIVAVHRYPLAPERCTEAAAYSDVTSYRATLTHLKSILEATGQQQKPLAITEANITWEGDPAAAALGASPGTFPAALWLADNLGASLEAGLYSVDYWSLSEGWTLGFFDGSSPRPAFHVLRLFSRYFGTEALGVTGAPSGTSVYAGRDAALANTSVFVVNTMPRPLELSLSFADHPRSAPLSLSVPATSLTLALVPDDGSPPELTSYTADMAEPLPASP
jgi:hypothetical protein